MVYYMRDPLKLQTGIKSIANRYLQEADVRHSVKKAQKLFMIRVTIHPGLGGTVLDFRG